MTEYESSFANTDAQAKDKIQQNRYSNSSQD